MRIAAVALALLACACNNEIDYTMGSGAVYVTRCAARMAVDGDTYRALCTPPDCAEGYHSVAVNDVAVALDPGTKVIGNGERVCVQDLAQVLEQAGIKVNGEPVGP